MPFGLKNAKAAYQRLVNKVFEPLIEHTMEVYVDDMIVKIMHDAKHRPDLRKMLKILRTYGIKLNLNKCLFGVRPGNFMGLIISSQGIQANPDKAKVVLDINRMYRGLRLLHVKIRL